ncbi:hypothetical protein ABZ468_08120 [Streptomyces sp. NPDC005708]|uniref:hypothetical protein n=1 Tax=Streptomyces sp. NPDC005708 TaxID=3154564 RepID=UPI0033E21170
MSGPHCGNNPRFELTDADRQAVEDFKAYLQRRAAGGPPERELRPAEDDEG